MSKPLIKGLEFYDILGPSPPPLTWAVDGACISIIKNDIKCCKSWNMH